MAPNKIYYINEVSVRDIRELCDILDVDDNWKDLGGHMKYDVTTLTVIGERAQRAKGSPTWDLLEKFKELNGTVNQLFRFLYKMKHQRAMTFLKNYVDPEYHLLLRRKDRNTINLNKESSASPHLRQDNLNVPNASKATFPQKSTDANSTVKENSVNKDAENCKSQNLLHFAGDCLHIPYEDIRKATDGFHQNRILGKGGFGTVYRGEWKEISVAIKQLPPKDSDDDPSLQSVNIKQVLNELNFLKRYRFDHILPLYAVSLDGESPCLIYQFMVNGSLEDRLLCRKRTPPLTWSQRSHIAEGTTKGLNYLHTSKLVHGDIKSANILLDINMNAIIGDFGLTRNGPECNDTHVTVSRKVGTKCYLPPEYLRDNHLSSQVDIYAYGIVLLEIATGLRPLDWKRSKGKLLTEYVRMSSDAGLLETIRDVKAGEENMIWFQELIRIGLVCSSDQKKKRPPMSQVLMDFKRIKQDVSIVNNIGISPTRQSVAPETLRVISKFETPKSVQKEIPAAVPTDVYAEACDSSLERAAPIPLLTVLRLQVSEGISSHLSDHRSSITDSQDYTSED